VTNLTPRHCQHLQSEAFTDIQITELVERYGVRSLTQTEALEQGFKIWDGKQWQSSAGILFPFTNTFAQLRCDAPVIHANGKPAKYITQAGRPSQALLPDGCRVITEGFKDAVAATLHGGIPTGAIAGVSHYRKALMQGCGYTIIFDADGWTNPQVFANLIHAGKWCSGRVLILPEIPDAPKAGLCEFFKAGYGAKDFQKLLMDGALTPEEMLEEWPNHWESLTALDRVKCARIAAKLARLYMPESEAKAFIRRLTEKHRDSGLTIPDLRKDAEAHLKARESREAKEKRKTIAEQLISIGKTTALWHSPAPDTVAYVDVMVSNNRHTYRIRGTDFKRWLSRQLYEQAEQAANSEALTSALNVLEGEALFAGSEMEIFTRVAHYDGRFYLDLGTSDWSAVEYGADGWRVVQQPPVRFARSRCSAALPIPTRGGNLMQLFDLINASEEDYPLILGFLLKCLVPDGTEPILILYGEQGSGKSAAAESLKRLIDPAKPNMLKTVSDVRTIGIFASQNRVILYDNLSHLTPEASDLLCSMATGGGHAERTLCTDNELTVFEFKRPQILTGIDEIATRGDLLDRALTVELDPIAGGNYIKESEYRERFDTMHPSLLGALLDAVCSALSNKAATPQPIGTRMVDFAHLAISAETYLGFESGTFLERLLENKAHGHEIAMESSPVAVAIGNLLNIKWNAEWSGTPTELLEALNQITDDQTRRKSLWPATPRSLGKALKRVAPNLRAMGVNVKKGERTDKSGSRKYIVSRCSTEQDKTPETPEMDKAHQGKGFTSDVLKMQTPETANKRQSSDVSGAQTPEENANARRNDRSKIAENQGFPASKSVSGVSDVSNTHLGQKDSYIALLEQSEVIIDADEF
jgi:hypothetical protein